ncbi:proton-conducting transporter membrane subunit [Sciscionella marina]|uniref:proton-conducting transporter transmembrane domain-containing protein n=1 Tax=Sciscionella marina TaxID=508770 RepID=UPI000382A956|nr:proton-conducting transporter membrane subunit [Sciscionella marina]
MNAVFIAGYACCGLALVVDVVFGVSRPSLRPAPYLLAAVASVLFTLAGAEAMAGHGVTLHLDAFFGFGDSRLVVGRLSGLFLVLVFGVATLVSVVTVHWARRPGQVRARGLASAQSIALAAIATILSADNVFCFLFAWEALTLSFYLIVAHDRGRAGRPNAANVTVILGKISGAFLLLGFLLLSSRSGSFTISSFTHVSGGGVRDAAYALLLAGFAVKVGVIPFHVWMPRGYAAAPGPLRALLAGVAVNVGFYGMWRTLEVLGRPPVWLVVVLLLLASCTAVLGIVHTTVQTRLTEVVAYSSVENGGLITVGFAVALVGAALAKPQLIGIGLVAATLQMIAHAIAKSLLFCSTATIEAATGTVELEQLRGVGHRLRTSGAGLAVGAVTLAGLPLTVGFVSEWFLLEALMQQFRVGHLYFALPLAISGALVALTVGFAAVAFVRIVGLTVLGPRGWHEVHRQLDAGGVARIGLLVLAFACLAIAAVTPLELTVVTTGLSEIVPRHVLEGVSKSPWIVQPVYPDFSILSPSWLIIAIPVLALCVLAIAIAFGRHRVWRIRSVPAWRSATSGVAGENQYTPFGFANPTRKVLANVLLTRSELHVLEAETGGQQTDQDHDIETAHLGYTSDVAELVEKLLYRPLLKPFLGLIHIVKRLQNGRLDAYVSYMLIAFVAVLAVVVALN